MFDKRMNEKMFQPEPEKVPETKMLPEDLQNKILDEQKVAHEKDVQMWAPPVKEEPKATKHWAWGHRLSPWRKEQLEKAMPQEEAPVAQADLTQPEENRETESKESIDITQIETLRSADEEPASGIRETIRSDFRTKGTIKTSLEEQVPETKERPKGFVAKEVPSYEIGAMGKEPIKRDGSESGDDDTLRAA